MKWTLIWAFTGEDGGITSVQQIVCTGEDPEQCARDAYREHRWLEECQLVAAVRGEAEIRVRDDARGAEFGLE